MTNPSLGTPAPPPLAIATIDANHLVLEARGLLDNSLTDAIRQRFADLTGAGVRHFTVEFADDAVLGPQVANLFEEELAHLRDIGGSLRCVHDRNPRPMEPAGSSGRAIATATAS